MYYDKKNMVKKTGTQENSAWIRQNTRNKQKTKLRSLRKSESGTSDNTDKIDQSESKKKSKGLINQVISEKRLKRITEQREVNEPQREHHRRQRYNYKD